MEVEFNDHIAYYNEIGQYHRVDGPAIIYDNFTECWYFNGELHREDGPAIIFGMEIRFTGIGMENFIEKMVQQWNIGMVRLNIGFIIKKLKQKIFLAAWNI